MRGLARSAIISTLLTFAASEASASASPWSITVYGGPATYTVFTQIVAGKTRLNGGMLSIAADRRLAYLGWGWNLLGEVQFQQFAFGTSYTTGSAYPSIALGLGVEYHHFPWEETLPTAVSIFMGPSYSFGPPQAYPTAAWGRRKSLLNYLSFEFAFAVPKLRNWDAVLRVYHRSGVWGIYSLDADECSVVGVGLRYRF